MTTRKETNDQRSEPEPGRAPEDQPGEPGAEGGSTSDTKDRLPGAPSKDDSPLGDTDQHSSVYGDES